MLKTILAFIIMSLSFKVLAGGDRVGNGGDVVVCKNSVELLDIYEARVNGYEFQKNEGSNYKELLENLLHKNLGEIQPRRTQKYLDHLKTFESEANFLPGIILNDIDDSGMVAIPKGCKLKQIVIQLADNERPPGKKRYTVSLDLWNRLDDFNKMALALHEIVYREAITNKASNSMIVRALVGEIIRDEIDVKEFLTLDWHFSKSLEFKKFYVKDLIFQPELNFYVNDYQELVFQISSKMAFKSDYVSSYYGVDFLVIRLSDEKILNATVRSQVVSLFLRANETYDFSNNLAIKSSIDIDYKDSSFLSPKNYNLEMLYKEAAPSPIRLSLTDVKNFGFGPMGLADLVGNFSLKYKGLNFDSSAKNRLNIDQKTGDVKHYSLGSGNARFELDNGVFNCRSYVDNSGDGYRYSVFYDCAKDGTKFAIKINNRPAVVALESTAANIAFSDEKFFTEGAKLIFSSKLLLGNNRDDEEVFLEAGVYEVRSSTNFMTLTDARGHRYTIDRGEVSETE